MWDEIHQEGFMGLGKEVDDMGAQRLLYLPIFYIATTSCDFIFGQWGYSITSTQGTIDYNTWEPNIGITITKDEMFTT